MTLCGIGSDDRRHIFKALHRCHIRLFQATLVTLKQQVLDDVQAILFAVNLHIQIGLAIDNLSRGESAFRNMSIFPGQRIDVFCRAVVHLELIGLAQYFATLSVNNCAHHPGDICHGAKAGLELLHLVYLDPEVVSLENSVYKLLFRFAL